LAQKRKRKSNRYFTQEHEDAIVNYALTDDLKIRTELYGRWIGPAFDQMVDKIVYTYKFTNLPNIESLKDECKVWLTTILDKFEPSKGSKAFSYFSVITKNWFIHKVKKNTKMLQREVQYDILPVDVEKKYMVTYNPYEKDREEFEFWFLLNKEIDKWENLKLKEKEQKVLNAIRILMESVDEIEIFNKKAIYLYMREITGLNTKQIVNNLNKIRSKYIQDAIENINNDRAIAMTLLQDLMQYLKGQEERHQTVGHVAAKYLETLQRSNEQLVKISSLVHKKTSDNFKLTGGDKEEIYSLISQQEE